MSTILLLAPANTATAVAGELHRSLDATIEVAATHRAALNLLRRRDYSLILIDEPLVAEPGLIDLLYQSAGGATIVELNFAICGAPRLVRQTRSALSRRAYDQHLARAAAAAALHNELNATLAGLLLQSQLALREASPAQAPKLRHLVQLAGDLCRQLRP